MAEKEQWLNRCKMQGNSVSTPPVYNLRHPSHDHQQSWLKPKMQYALP